MRPAENNLYADVAFSRAGRLATLQQARPEQREAATAQLKQHLEVAQRSNFDIVREGAEIFAQAQLDFDRIYHPERVSEWLRKGDCYPIYVEIGPTNRCNHHCIFWAFNKSFC